MLAMEFEDNDCAILLDYPDLTPENPVVPSPITEPANVTQLPKSPSNSTEFPRFWTWDFYLQFFDVDTDEVLRRLKTAVFPFPAVDFLADVIQNKPDFYGPFWICLTFAVEIGFTSDLAFYLHDSFEKHWKSNVRTVYRALVLLFSYCWIFPTVIWTVLEWNAISDTKYRITQILCVYSYATTVFIPLAVLWTFTSRLLRWASTAVGVFISGILICRSLKNVLVNLERIAYFALQILMFTLNALIWSSFSILFYPVNQFSFKESIVLDTIPNRTDFLPLIMSNTTIQYGSNITDNPLV